MESGRVPSYKAIAMSILNNDVSLKKLGFQGKHSDWYSELKRIEISKRQKRQMDLFHSHP